MQRARTTLILDQELLQRAKKNALEMRTTLTEYIEDALRLREKIVAEPKVQYEIPTFSGKGMPSGYSLDRVNALDALFASDEELLEMMESGGEDDPV
jgi:hypothetical protein